MRTMLTEETLTYSFIYSKCYIYVSKSFHHILNVTSRKQRSSLSATTGLLRHIRDDGLALL